MLHYLDDLDSKMEAMRAQFERGGESEGAWTGYNPSLGRPLLNTAKFLAPKTSAGRRELAAEPPLASEKSAAGIAAPSGLGSAGTGACERKERRRHDIRRA